MIINKDHNLLGSCNDRAKQLHNSPSGRLLTALICEYLDWAQLNHTLKVYLPECNLPKESWKSELKEFSSKHGYDLNRNGESGPLLLDVLESFLKYEYEMHGNGDEPIDLEFKEMMLQNLIEDHRRLYSPSETLKLAKSAGCVPELLEAHGCAYLATYRDLSDEIDRLIKIDDKDQFASFLLTNHDKIKKFSPVDVFESVCKANAVGCASVFLDSQLAADVCVSDVSKHSGMAPLHTAVVRKSHGLVDLLLSHGALVDVPSCSGTPITLALESLRCCPYVCDWISHEQPISYFKLIDFLGSPEMEQRIDIIRMLVSRTKQLRWLCVRSIEIGQSFKLAVLLFVARDKLLVPSSDEGGLEDTPIMQYISEELAQESENKKYKNEFMIDALNAIENFWRFERVQKHEVPCDIASDPVRDVGFDSEPSVVSPHPSETTSVIGASVDKRITDILDSLRLKPTSKAEVPSRKICCEEQISYGSTSPLFVGAKYTSRLNCSTLRLRSPSPTNRAFHTWQAAVNFNIFKPVENRLFKTLQVKPSLRNALVSATSLLGIAKRCIK